MSIKKRKIEISEVIALVSAVFALLALFVSIYTALVTERVATSGFQSAEKVKSDTASLMAAPAWNNGEGRALQPARQDHAR